MVMMLLLVVVIIIIMVVLIMVVVMISMLMAPMNRAVSVCRVTTPSTLLDRPRATGDWSHGGRLSRFKGCAIIIPNPISNSLVVFRIVI
jgi:hypothetical protein